MTTKEQLKAGITALYRANCIAGASLISKHLEEGTPQQQSARKFLVAEVIATNDLAPTAEARVLAEVWKRLWGKVNKEVTSIRR